MQKYYYTEEYFTKLFPYDFLQRCNLLKHQMNGEDEDTIKLLLLLSVSGKECTLSNGITLVASKRHILKKEGFDWDKEDVDEYKFSTTCDGKVYMTVSAYIIRCLYEVGFVQDDQTRNIAKIILDFMIGEQRLHADLNRNDHNSEFIKKVLRWFVKIGKEKQDDHPINPSRVKTAYVYLVHPAIARPNIFKVGMTCCIKTNGTPTRIKSYGKGTEVLMLNEVPVRMARKIEKEIIKSFRSSFECINGNEYFKGNATQMKVKFKETILAYDVNVYSNI